MDYSFCTSQYYGSSNVVIKSADFAAKLPASAPLSVDLREWGVMSVGVD